ncbi:MAG: hypothetical protein Q7K65_00155 [Candidatus Buchananbacteria bacterium]|nr:hypothetical protein [Candidatus Buchananbacteria bacterium]
MAEIKEINKAVENNNHQSKSGKRYAEALNKYFKLIVVLVVIIILLVGYYLIVAPKWKMKSAQDKSFTALQEEVAKLKADSEFLSQYSNKIIEFTPEEERQLSLALPGKFDLSSVIIQLTQLASEHSFIVENIQASEAADNGLKDGHIKRVDLEMKVSGLGGNNYGNFGRFIEALESSLMIFDVKAISFTPEEAGYKLELSTYYYPSE